MAADELGRTHRRIDLPVLLQPIDIPALCSQFHFSEKLHGLGLETRLAGIGIGNTSLHCDRHVETVGPYQSRSADPFAGQVHRISLGFDQP
jgi:hypothetical protein